MSVFSKFAAAALGGIAGFMMGGPMGAAVGVGMGMSTEAAINPFVPKTPDLPGRTPDARRETGAEIRIGDAADNIKNSRITNKAAKKANPLGNVGRGGRSGLNI